MLTLQSLTKIMPCAGPRAASCVGPLNTAMVRFAITTPSRQAEFLGQLAHESAQLACFTENLNYNAAALMRTWPKRFPTIALANDYARQPIKLANYVYANRGGNGDVASGDGFHFRGAGWIQITFRDNHQAVANAFNLTLEQVGDWMRTPEGAALSAAWFWSTHGCNALADQGNTDAISDVINLGHRTPVIGDALGYADRLAFRNTALQVLA